MSDSSDQFEVFPRLLHLRQVDPARNLRRFYRLMISRNLFGKTSLVHEWGRIGSPGQMLVETHADEGQAVDALMRRAHAMQKKGFVA